MRITLKDIADKTGFSVNTVSHALKDKPDISEESKKIIRQVASEMGYIVNNAASSMRSGRSNTVAAILPDLANPHFAIMLQGIENYFSTKGITVFVLNTGEDEDRENNAIVASIGRNVDGIIICPTQKSIRNIEFLKKSGIPFVLVGRHYEEIDADYVVCDDKGGGYAAAECLLRAGHTEIAILSGSLNISSARERLSGYRRALSDYGIEYDESKVVNISVKARNNKELIRSLMTRCPGCTAIVAFSDILAYEAISVLAELGKSVPGDISVVGFDNICSDYVFPLPLTSVSVAKKTMAQAASEMLYKKIGSPAGIHSCEHIILPTELKIRQTVEPIRKA